MIAFHRVGGPEGPKLFSEKLTTGFVATALVCCGHMAAADVCHVPSGSFPAIQGAVDTPSCTEVVLAAQSFRETVVVSRSLELRCALPNRRRCSR